MIARTCHIGGGANGEEGEEREDHCQAKGVDWDTGFCGFGEEFWRVAV